MIQNLLTEQEASEYLNVKVRTLRNFRHLGLPPKYIKICRLVRYDVNDLQKFVNVNKIDPIR